MPYTVTDDEGEDEDEGCQEIVRRNLILPNNYTQKGQTHQNIVKLK